MKIKYLRRTEMSREKTFGKVLRKYIREDGKPIGVIVATSPNNIGYSICNMAAGDQFSRKKALSKAVGRANSQAACGLSFWIKVVIKKLLNSKDYQYITEKEIDNYFNSENETEIMELRALKGIKRMEQIATNYTW